MLPMNNLLTTLIAMGPTVNTMKDLLLSVGGSVSDLPQQVVVVEQPDTWLYWLIGSVCVPVGLALFNWWRNR